MNHVERFKIVFSLLKSAFFLFNNFDGRGCNKIIFLVFILYFPGKKSVCPEITVQ